jgi:kynureninase
LIQSAVQKPIVRASKCDCGLEYLPFNNMEYSSELAYTLKMDEEDSLGAYRAQFHLPIKQGNTVIYFCGNSLGLQPVSILDDFQKEFDKWKAMGVEGHFSKDDPWVHYHQKGKIELSHLLGTKNHEVVLMNNLTTNLHVLLATFYRPNGNRKKVIIEKGAFPSDHYAITSFVEMKGGDPEMDVIQLQIPNDGYLSNQHIIEKIESTGEELALVLLPGIQYYTGQFFDLQSITEAAHRVGAFAGFDLAHAIGNVPMSLHKDKVDFATWCSYKYLNSGPGNVAGIYIHETHASKSDLPRLGGWWGQQPDSRFLMDNVNRPDPSINGWLMSNTNILATSMHLASLRMFYAADIQKLREKSIKLTGFLEFLLLEDPIISKNIRILTPGKPKERGCQLSLYLLNHGKEIFDFLIDNGVVLDWREPNVIRVAPVPMYNTFSEVRQFVKIMKNAFLSEE